MHSAYAPQAYNTPVNAITDASGIVIKFEQCVTAVLGWTVAPPSLLLLEASANRAAM